MRDLLAISTLHMDTIAFMIKPLHGDMIVSISLKGCSEFIAVNVKLEIIHQENVCTVAVVPFNNHTKMSSITYVHTNRIALYDNHPV